LWLPHVARIYLLFVYSKEEGDTLSSEQKQALKLVVKTIKVGGSHGP